MLVVFMLHLLIHFILILKFNILLSSPSCLMRFNLVKRPKQNGEQKVEKSEVNRGAEPAGGGGERSVKGRFGPGITVGTNRRSQQINASFPLLSAPAWKVSSSGSCCIQKLERR
ncbi:hypothetical protein AMECASPLE_015481 [Ameca splendens]|uniref:Uncharacterized protein n=1 Tax=Ameca splendens TaxID=208324 RepID=A0ABV0YCZ5_9TELE